MYKKLFIIAIIILVIVIIILIVAFIIGNKKYSYEQFETKMIELSKSYYQNRKELLPDKDTERTVLSLNTLINSGLIKPLDRIIKNGESCSGEIEIINNNNNYLYIPYLDCNTYYQSTTLSSLLLEDKNIVVSGNGLYKTDNGYIFKGDNVNNYLKFKEDLWRIIKVFDDGSIKAINTKKTNTYSWDDRYNIDRESNYGINDFVTENINSRVKDVLETIYNEYDEQSKAYFINQSLCIGKRKITDTINDGSIECSNIIEKQPVGLLYVSEYLNASLDSNCTSINTQSCINYNYLNSIGKTWTLTADFDTSYKVFRINNGTIKLSNASNNNQLKIVVIFNSKLLYSSGNGTETDPYIFK